MQLMIKTGSRYRAARRDEILSTAIGFAVQDAPREVLSSPAAVIRALQRLIGARETEAFYTMALDTHHGCLAFSELFTGTIDGAPVFPREVARWALAQNAAALVVCHNHPSGHLEPSPADEAITRRLKDALGLFDIRLLDHFIVTSAGTYSFVEHGLI